LISSDCEKNMKRFSGAFAISCNLFVRFAPKAKKCKILSSSTNNWNIEESYGNISLRKTHFYVHLYQIGLKKSRITVFRLKQSRFRLVYWNFFLHRRRWFLFNMEPFSRLMSDIECFWSIVHSKAIKYDITELFQE
jgi:hypothetical protein